MNKVTRVKNDNYTTISNVFLRNDKLSLKAKGLLATILSLPETWDFSIKGICSIVKEGTTAVYSAIDELKTYGYCIVETLRDEKGRVVGNDYTFFENPNLENLNMDNQAQLNKDIINISLPNTENNPIKEEIKKENIKRNRNEYSDDFEKAWELAQRKGSKTEAYKYWKRLKEEDKKKVFAHLPFYYKSNERRYLKDFSGYLNRCYYSSVVYDKQGHVLYDPEREQSFEYRPNCDGSLVWNDFWHCYMYVGFWDGKHIPDGYSDDNRPDGASVTLNNGRGTMVWSASAKTWNKVQN